MAKDNDAERKLMVQCSVHHWFDLETQQSAWVVMKANNIVQKSIEDHMERVDLTRNGYGSDPLSRCLGIHDIVCTRAMDNWHLYISDLEYDLQKKTGNALFTRYEEPQANNSRRDPKDLKLKQFALPQKRRQLRHCNISEVIGSAPNLSDCSYVARLYRCSKAAGYF